MMFLKYRAVERWSSHSPCMKTVRRYTRELSLYSLPFVVSRLSLVTIPNSSTPVSSGMHVNLPTPNSSAVALRVSEHVIDSVTSSTLSVAAERKAVAIGPCLADTSGIGLRALTLTYESASAASALRALEARSYSAATRKTPACSSRFQNITYVAPDARAASISSLGIVCASASPSPDHQPPSAEVPGTPYSMTPPTTGTKAIEPMKYSLATAARSSAMLEASPTKSFERVRMASATGEAPSTSTVAWAETSTKENCFCAERR